jgi:subtilase family serine protease
MRIQREWKWKRFSLRSCAPAIVFALLFFLFVPATQAEEALRPARITQEIGAGTMVELRGSVHPLTAKARDLGAVDPRLRLEGMRLDISPTTVEQKEIEALMAEQQQPSSPHYHKWLTQQQYGALFGLGESDLRKIKAWLLSQGFAIVAVSPARNSVTFSGTVAQAEAAFQTRMRRFEWRGETRMANATALHIPAALAGVVTHIGGVQGFHLQPKVKRNPRYTSVSYSGYHLLSPADWATIYSVNAIYSAGYTGSGIHVGIVGQTYFPQSDVDDFRAAAGLPATSLNMVCLSANTSDDPCTGTNAESVNDMTEADLDVEWAGGIAKDATVDFLYYGYQSSYGAIDALQYAITTYTVNGKVLPVISSSYGACEPYLEGYTSAFDAAISEAALQGQTILSAAGDSGAADCDQYSPASNGLAVDWPGSNPNVVSVGGSTFNDGGNAANPELGADPPFWTYSSTSDIVSSARQYIPEVAWNDTAYDSSYGDLASGGGGVSILYPHPGWQLTPTGYTGAVMRFVPDVSFSASADYVPYLICTQEFPSGATSGSQSTGPSCTSNTFYDASGYLTPVGGTSASTPSFAGMLTLLVQKYGSLGAINPVFYSLASNSTTYAAVFHDITSGDNIQPCAYQSPDCVGASSTTNGTMGYSAQAGYDLATGLGSVNGGALMAALAQASPLVLSISTSSGSSGTTITVTGANFTGSSLVLWNGIALATTYVNSTELVATIPASDLETAGTALITVTNASGTSAAVPYTTVNSGQAPSISGVSILESSGSYLLAVQGENFLSGSQVLWNGSSRTTAYNGPGLLSAQISATDYASRPATVKVSGSKGSSAAFTVH